MNGGMTLKSIKAVFVHTRWSDQTCTREQGKLAGENQTEIAQGSAIVWDEAGASNPDQNRNQGSAPDRCRLRASGVWPLKPSVGPNSQAF